MILAVNRSGTAACISGGILNFSEKEYNLGQMDDHKKQDDNNLPAAASVNKVYEVDIWRVKEVAPGDAKQAQATIEALMKANLRTRLAAHGLEYQGYEIEKLAINQQFSDLSGKVAEIAVSEEATAVYELVEKPLLGPGTQPLEEAANTVSLVKIETMTDVANIGQSNEEDLLKRIEMTVVQRKEQPKQIEEGNSNVSIFSDWVTLEDKKAA